MSLPWVRLDTAIADHPKMLGLFADKRHRAVLGYILGIAYSGRHELDGFVPRAALTVLQMTRSDAESLVESELWDLCEGGWMIHGWAGFQISGEEAQRRREKAQRAAQARWHKGEDAS
jgi:hypothetical protein